MMLDDTHKVEIADTADSMTCAIEAANSGHGSAKSGLERGLQAMIWPNAFGTLGWDWALPSTSQVEVSVWGLSPPSATGQGSRRVDRTRAYMIRVTLVDLERSAPGYQKRLEIE